MRTYDKDMLQTMSKFEKITNAKLKDIAEHKDNLIFIVEEGEMGKALGKGKKNVHKLRKAFNKKIKIVEYVPKVTEFVKNLLFPLEPNTVQQDQDTIVIEDDDRKTKGLIIGSKASNLRKYESIVNRYFEIEEIKVQ